METGIEATRFGDYIGTMWNVSLQDLFPLLHCVFLVVMSFVGKLDATLFSTLTAVAHAS